MKTTTIKKTKVSVKFADITPGAMFYADDLYWTKSTWSIMGVWSATAFAGYVNEVGGNSKTFDNDKSVFTVTIE